MGWGDTHHCESPELSTLFFKNVESVLSFLQRTAVSGHVLQGMAGCLVSGFSCSVFASEFGASSPRLQVMQLMTWCSERVSVTSDDWADLVTDAHRAVKEARTCCSHLFAVLHWCMAAVGWSSIMMVATLPLIPRPLRCYQSFLRILTCLWGIQCRLAYHVWSSGLNAGSLLKRWSFVT